MSKFWPTTDLIGGGFGALDKIDGNSLNDGDVAIVSTENPAPAGITYFYKLDADSGAAESVPDVIAPDTNPGTKRWLLQEVYLGLINHLSFNNDPVNVPIVEGTQFWNTLTHCPAWKTDIAASTWDGPLEDWTRIRNKTGALIPDGAAVVGCDSTDPLVFDVDLALAVPGPLAGITGIATSDIPDWIDGVELGEGFATTRGNVADYDTSGFSPMALLYVSDTVPGALTTTPPAPPNYPIPIGFSKDQQAGGNIYVFTTNPAAIIAAVDAAVASGDPTGFHDNDNIVVEYDSAARTITLTGDLKYSWRGQVHELTSPWTSDPHPAGLDVNYYLSSINGLDFTWSLNAWAFDVIQVAFVTYNTINKYALREVHGLMNWQSHEEFHDITGTYRKSGGTLSNYVEASTTPADRRPDVASSSIKDEDLRTINAALLSSSLYTTAFLAGAGVLTFNLDETDIVNLNGNIPYWNFFDGVDWVQEPMTNGQYMSLWVIAVPATEDATSQKYRYEFMQGQSSTGLVTQEAQTPQDLSLGSFAALFTEFVFMAKVIIRFTANNWQIYSVENLTGTRSSSTSSPSGNYLSVVEHDETLAGTGTTGDPLTVSSSVKDHETIAGPININPVEGTEHIGDFDTSFTGTLTGFTEQKSSIVFLLEKTGVGTATMSLAVGTGTIIFIGANDLTDLEANTYMFVVQLFSFPDPADNIYAITVGIKT